MNSLPLKLSLRRELCEEANGGVRDMVSSSWTFFFTFY